ncbi:transposase [Geobacillus sp. BMUD]|uniref:RNA-guided endonuclease InsQ/TnpB family protein n=1 Tax=Geobacillus sp. BMUD TaxID=2508876 RepID=UPI001491FBBB|nr:RNA-guided endonuclease TnpB family protein [Geobacillus sp. BMUD]NNU83872.1 transposase [Geobacillus sp. BMUD]
MYFCIKQQLNGLTKEEYLTLRELCHIAKNMYNVGLYNVRQYYFEHKEFLNYEKNYHLAKTNENYKLLNSNMAQQILKKVNEAFKSFFGLISLAKQGKYDHKAISIPKYLKKDGFHSLIIGQIRIDGNKFTIPYSRLFKKTHKPITITIPPVLLDKKIKQIEIIPKHHARFFEIQYKYEMPEDQRELNDQKALAIDLGLNNFATCVTSDGRSFIIDGRRLKSINQWFNKENARLQSIKDKQKIKGTTRKQALLAMNRNNKVNDYINKTCRYIINYCIENQIGKLVIGYAETWQRNINLGKKTNQNFVNIPLGNIKEKLEYLCEFYGIEFFKQEESYTSQASFFDGDEIPEYNADNPKEYKFSGKRIKRGLYRTKSGKLINADVNGALNILKKSKAVDLSVLCSSGEVDTPQRIRIA